MTTSTTPRPTTQPIPQAMCPSQYALARYQTQPAAQRAPEITAHVAVCARCTGVLEGLVQARTDLLGPDPQQASLLAARRVLAAVDERRAAKRRWNYWLPLGLAPVAAAFLLFAAVKDRPTAGLTDQGVRVKGALILEVFCKRGNDIFPVNEGADFYAGDRLRFAYSKPEPGFLTIFSVDDRGRIFPYYQDATLGSVAARAGAKVELPDSIELDGHRGWERIFALWSPRPLDEALVRQAVSAAVEGAGGDVRNATRLDLEAEQVSYLLRRP